MYPTSTTVVGRHDLVWRGELTPTGYSEGYEIVMTHNLRKSPLVYVIRPRLAAVTGKPLPHVFPLNTLCLHTLSQSLIASRLLADTLVPWTSEWLFFYELWRANGGTWLGEGEHPRIAVASISRVKATPGISDTASRTQEQSPVGESADRLARLKSALQIAYKPTPVELRDLLYNSRV